MLGVGESYLGMRVPSHPVTEVFLTDPGGAKINLFRAYPRIHESTTILTEEFSAGLASLDAGHFFAS